MLIYIPFGVCIGKGVCTVDTSQDTRSQLLPHLVVLGLSLGRLVAALAIRTFAALALWLCPGGLLGG